MLTQIATEMESNVQDELLITRRIENDLLDSSPSLLPFFGRN